MTYGVRLIGKLATILTNRLMNVLMPKLLSI